MTRGEFIAWTVIFAFCGLMAWVLIFHLSIPYCDETRYQCASTSTR